MPNFLETSRLYGLGEVRRNKSILPSDRGLYGLFFRIAPDSAPIEGCFVRDKMMLLYIGTAGADLRKKGNLRNRLGKNHVGGNERHSTVCQTLASLLPDVAGQCVARSEQGRVKFQTSADGVVRLREWMDANIAVCWVSHPRPGELEAEIVRRYNTPLNIKFSLHAFASTLTTLRDQRRLSASQLQDQSADHFGNPSTPGEG